MQAPLAELVDTATVHRSLGNGSLLLIDARGAARYRGEVEPLDPIAGHIPGAINRPFTDNLQADGRFKPATVLRAELVALLPAGFTTSQQSAQAASGDATSPHAQQTTLGATANSAPKAVVYCGSGVSAIATLLALELAGCPRPALYAGSWSAWSNTSGLPVERA